MKWTFTLANMKDIEKWITKTRKQIFPDET